MAATITPNAAAQFRPLALTITPATDGYRVAYAGGEVFEEIARFDDPVVAHLAMREAVGLTSALLWEVFS